MPKTVFEAQSYDSQPLMPNGTGSTSFIMIVSGQVTLGEGASKNVRGFSETFVIVPAEGDGEGFKIQSQVFRYVV